MSTITLDGVEIPIVGYGVMGIDGAGEAVVRQFDVEDEGFAREYVQSIEDEGGTAFVSPIIDIKVEEVA